MREFADIVRQKIKSFNTARAVWVGKQYYNNVNRFTLSTPKKIFGAKNLRLEPLS
jgi:hypothetical protein